MMTGVSAGDAYRERELSMWFQGFGTIADQDNRQGISGYDADTAGAAIGADMLFGENFRAGLALSYAATDVDANGSADKTSIDSYQGSLYGSYTQGDYFFDGIVSFGRNDNDGARNVVVGTVNRTARGDFSSDQTSLTGRLGRNYYYNDLTVTPYASLLYVNLDTDGYTETGAGAANLVVGSETTELLQSTFGVSISKEMRTAAGARFIPEAHIAWLHEYFDETQANTSTFTGGGAAFNTAGFDPANDSLNIGGSVAVFKENNIDVRAAYDFEIKDDYSSHSGQLVLRYTFD